MSFLKRSSNYVLFMLMALCSAVYGHTYLSSVYLDGKLLNEGDCVRPHPSTAYDSPIPLVTSPDMTCGWLPDASKSANRKCPVAAGSKIGIQWHHSSNSPSDDIMDPTHKGPVMVYLAKSEDGSKNVWFKIFEDGLVNGAWGVDRMLANKGRLDVTIPADIAPGNYLLRGEILALHSAYDVNGVQPYVGCVELTVSGSGSATPAGVALPGAYKNTDPGMVVNIYNTVTSYIIPGPAVYKAGSGSGSNSGSNAGSNTAAPTTKPPTSATTRPTNAPVTSAPESGDNDNNGNNGNTGNGGNLKVQVNGGSNIWWFAVELSGGSEDTVKVELADSGSVKNYYIMSKAAYGWFFSQSIQLTLPISLRFTSASGKQVVVQNFVNSFTDSSVKDTQKNYGSSSSPATSAPATSAPVTSRPTNAPTQAATNAPATKAPTVRPTSAPATQAPSNGNGITVKQHSGASAWWFALSVDGIDADKISKVEIKDSDKVSSFKAFEATNWGYFTYTTGGSPLVAPLSIRVTSNSGAQTTVTFNSIAGNAEAKSTL